MASNQGNTPGRLRTVARPRIGGVPLLSGLIALSLGLVAALVCYPQVGSAVGLYFNSTPTTTETPIKKLTRYEMKKVIQTASSWYDVPPELVWAVIEVESNFDTRAKSRAGAMGLMQLMPKTARELNVGNPYDPVQNIYGGTHYLGKLLKRYKGNKRLALAAYNAGPRKVKKFRGVPPYRETQNYVRRVLSVYDRERGAKTG